MASLKQAFFLNDLSGELPDSCSRIYYGAEFCFWRMPSAKQLCLAIEMARERSLAFTLVTPVIGEAERQQLAKLLQQVLPELSYHDEVVISDWGALELVRSARDDLQIVLGRALSGQKRGPRILDLELTPEQKEYFQRTSWHNREAAAMLREQGISRFEQDNLLQGLAPLPEGMTSSLHIPYAMVTSSRNCPFRKSGEIGPCSSTCDEVLTLQSDEVRTTLFQHGNTQFLHHDTLPENLPALGIDRIVTHPDF